jgi:oligosaccharide amylase
MPKSIVLGNGNMLVGFDKFARVSDFYFPYVGLEDQLGEGDSHKIGVFIDGVFSWIDDGTWEIKITYEYETLIGKIYAFNHNLGIKLEFRDCVYNEKDIFIREVAIFNLKDIRRVIKIFFHQNFEIYGSRKADTAYFDPITHTIIHYKGRRAFLVNLASFMESFDDYSIGNYSQNKNQGTFMDAIDGKLEKNPIEHGLVDSVISFSATIEPDLSKTIYYWITCARGIKEAVELNKYVLQKTPQHLLKTTQDFWKAWVNKQNFCFCDLDQSVIDLFKRSILTIRTHVDNKGAIIASADSDMLQHGKDNYSYVWPRDGALVALALDKTGDSGIAKRFFEFCNAVITDEGYFMHKYRTDQSLGSSWHPWIKNGKLELPIQEDETALVIIALKQHFEISKDLEFIENIYNSLIKKAGDFMVFFRDEENLLPKPSYDLWEEKFGVHVFTASCVSFALRCCSDFAFLLGKGDEAFKFKKASEEIKEAIIKYFYSDELGFFYKTINFDSLLDGGGVKFDKTIDSSALYGIYKFNILEIGDQRLKKAFETTKAKLTLNSSVGGIARYEGDYYYRLSEGVCGNPWFITTLWLSQYMISSAQNQDDLKKVSEVFEWVIKYSNSAGLMSEQINPYTGEPISASPLTWSHAEYIITVLLYLKKSKQLNLCSGCSGNEFD